MGKQKKNSDPFAYGKFRERAKREGRGTELMVRGCRTIWSTKDRARSRNKKGGTRDQIRAAIAAC